MFDAFIFDQGIFDEMAAITVTLTDVCAGGDHLTFTMTGATNRTIPLFLPELSDPLTEDEAISFCRIIAKLTKQGRTGQQAKTRLQSGVAVAI